MSRMKRSVIKMRVFDYEMAGKRQRKQWLQSLHTKVGLSYFGGKSIIGKYIFNHIFNLTTKMIQDGKRPEIFIDAFTGGGKMGLSVPHGWYPTIVMNDLDYGVYSFYKCCMNNHIELIHMIEQLGKIMSSSMFKIFLTTRENRDLNMIAAGAMTFWCTASSFNCMLDPDSARYNLAHVKEEKGQNGEPLYDQTEEAANIEKIIKISKKRIPALHKQLIEENYIIENLDYKELIKKYNGLEWKDQTQKKADEPHPPIEENKRKNKLWYFDPPYHPWALHAGKDAPYANTFTLEQANDMVKLLAGEQVNEIGELPYFIKSDYDPKDILEKAREYAKAKENKDQEVLGEISSEVRKWYDEILYAEENGHQVTNVYKDIEDESKGFCKVCVGEFDKGALDANQKKTIGIEYVWCHGFEIGYGKYDRLQRLFATIELGTTEEDIKDFIQECELEYSVDDIDKALEKDIKKLTSKYVLASLSEHDKEKLEKDIRDIIKIYVLELTDNSEESLEKDIINRYVLADSSESNKEALEKDIKDLIDKYVLVCSSKENNKTFGNVYYKIAFEEGVTAWKNPDLGDYIEVSFNKEDGSFLVAEYFNNNTLKKAIYYNYGHYSDFDEAKPDNEYVGYYLQKLGDEKGGITIKYSSGQSKETGYHKVFNVVEALNNIIGQ